MRRWAVYAPNGSVLFIYSGPDFEAQLQAQGDLQVCTILDGLDDTTAYVDVDGITPKQPMPIVAAGVILTANGTDEAIISGIPAGVQVQWPDGQTDMVNDGEIRFSVDLPGTYTFRFTAVPYLDQEVVIEAIAAT